MRSKGRYKLGVTGWPINSHLRQLSMRLRSSLSFCVCKKKTHPNGWLWVLSSSLFSLLWPKHNKQQLKGGGGRGFAVAHSLRGHIPSWLGRQGSRRRNGAVHIAHSGSRVRTGSGARFPRRLHLLVPQPLQIVPLTRDHESMMGTSRLNPTYQMWWLKNSCGPSHGKQGPECGKHGTSRSCLWPFSPLLNC